MSVASEIRLPPLDSVLDRSVLARPERRQATARLRREFVRGHDDAYEDDKRLIRERMRFAEHLKLLNALKILSEKDARNALAQNAKKDVETHFSKSWQSQVQKGDIPERPHPTRKLCIPTPQLRQPISARNVSSAPMFRSTNVAFSADKEKRRMHFISTEWNSENVSWIRFHKSGLKDIHRLGWI